MTARSRPTTTLLVLVVAALVITLSPSPSRASVSSTAGDATPNFTESSSCGTYGMRGPYSPTTRIGSRIYGPFADFFGRTESQVSASTTWWAHPGGKSYQVHNRALAAYQEAATAIVTSGSGYRGTSGAAFNWRNIGGSRRMSHHAVGNAIDVNPGRNPYTSGPLITDMPPSYVAAWEASGFCWGGSWRWNKDAMHYTWRGPAADAGGTTRLAPYAPLIGAANFTQRALETSVSVPKGAPLYAMADRRRDGADDLYAVSPVGGNWHIDVAGAVSDFGVVGVRRTAGAPSDGEPLLGDFNGDGRADLWVLNASGTIEADIYYDSSRFHSIGQSVTTGASWSADAEVGLAVLDHDDWLPELYVFRRGTNQVEVYSSSSGYRDLTYSATLPASIGSDHIVLADRDNPTDGTADIWLITPGSPASIRVIKYTAQSGYTGPVETAHTGMDVSSESSVMPGDYDGDGRVDLYVLHDDRLEVWLGGVPDRPLSRLKEWHMPDGPVTFDAGPVCMGDCDTIGYTEPSGVWRLAREAAWAPEEANFYFGVPHDEPFLGDWDCDGVDTPGLYRRSDGYVYLRNTNTPGYADSSYFFGIPGDIPLAGDFDGDGCDSVSLYRPAEARFYIINDIGIGDAGLGAADFSFLFGDAGDKPFVGDFDGDGIDEVGLHRESTGRVYMRTSLTTGVADLDFIYGIPGDVLLAGDWNGDGTDTPAIFRPSDGNWYLRMENTPGYADHVIPFGLRNRGYRPVAGRASLESGGLGTLSSCESCPDVTEFEPHDH